MTDVRARIADALRAHGEFYDRETERLECNCRQWTEETFDDACGHLTHAEHLADVLLSLPDIAVVELPEPDDTGSGGDGEFAAWWGRYPDNDPHQSPRWRGHDVFEQEGFVFEGTRQQKPALARALAAALLAAADAAEQAANHA